MSRTLALAMATRIYNMRWGVSDKKTIFDSVRVPCMGLEDYLLRLLTELRADESLAVLVIVYLDKFLKQTGSVLTVFNQHRLVCSSFLLAHKYLEDCPFTSKRYTRIAGITEAEQEGQIRLFIKGLEWKLWIKDEEFLKHKITLQFCARMCSV
jgi:hypothetical protein